MTAAARHLARRIPQRRCFARLLIRMLPIFKLMMKQDVVLLATYLQGNEELSCGSDALAASRAGIVNTHMKT